MYAAGQTDEVKGTGVFSSFELKREKEDMVHFQKLLVHWLQVLKLAHLCF